MCVKTPLVSIIIPVYKVEPYIRQALDSVINQTYKTLQIILVDDGSPDNSGAICDEYAQQDSRVQVIHKENGGVSSARNAGIDAAVGEWIYFMDPDDWIEPETISVCMETAAETGTDAVIFSLERFKGNKTWASNDFCKIKEDGSRVFDRHDYETLKIYRLSLGACTTVMRASRIKGRLRFEVDLRIHEDIYFKYQLWQEIQSFCLLPNVFYHYRISPDSATTKRSFRRQFGEYMTAHKKVQQLFKTGRYPEKTEMLENTRFISNLMGLLTSVLIDDPTLSFQEKKKAILSVVEMEEFQAVMNMNEPIMLSKAVKVFLRLRKCPVMATYVIYLMRKIKYYL